MLGFFFWVFLNFWRKFWGIFPWFFPDFLGFKKNFFFKFFWDFLGFFLFLIFFFNLSSVKIMWRNLQQKLQNISFLWVCLMRQMAPLCKNFIYVHPDKVLTKSACMSWAIKEENVQSMSSSSLDPQDLSAQPLSEIQRRCINVQQTSAD